MVTDVQGVELAVPKREFPGCECSVLRMDTSDGGNADAFVELFGAEFLFVRELGWLHWTGTYWKRDNGELMLYARESLALRNDWFYRCKEVRRAGQVQRSTHRIDAFITQVQAMLSVGMEEFDKSPDELNVANGVLNLQTGELTPHSPEQRFTYCLNAEYDEHADTSIIEGFVGDVLTEEGSPPNTEIIDFVQTALGYSLTGHTREEKLFYCYGKLGRNGKGTLTETLMTLLPYPLAQEIDFNTFISKRDGDSQNFDLADMKPSRILFASESNKYQMLNPATIKKLTGGNYVRAAHKYKDFFMYRPQYKPWLSSNHRVNGDPDDHVMWNRVLVIEFPNSYMGREVKKLKEQLQSPEVQAGLLAWLVRGAQRWYREELVIPEQVLLATRKQQKELDTFGDWAEESLRSEPGAFTPHAKLYQNYVAWCEMAGVPPKGRNQFSESMQKNGYTKVKKGRDNVTGYTDIILVTTYTKSQGQWEVFRVAEEAPRTKGNGHNPRQVLAASLVESLDFDPDGAYDIEGLMS